MISHTLRRLRTRTRRHRQDTGNGGWGELDAAATRAYAGVSRDIAEARSMTLEEAAAVVVRAAGAPGADDVVE